MSYETGTIRAPDRSCFGGYGRNKRLVVQEVQQASGYLWSTETQINGAARSVLISLSPRCKTPVRRGALLLNSHALPALGRHHLSFQDEAAGMMIQLQNRSPHNYRQVAGWVGTA